VSTALQRGLRTALTSPGVVALAFLAVAGEALVRVVAGMVHPVFAVLVPPVVAVPVLGAALPSVRRLFGDAEDSDEPLREDLVSTLRDRGGGLLALAVLGHACSLFVGTGLFLAVDTPVRYWLYWAGYDPLSTAVVLGVPLLGVAVGTTTAWGLFVPAVDRVGSGAEWQVVVRAPLVALIAPRRTAGLLLAFGGAGALAALGGVAALVARGPGTPGILPGVATGIAGALLALAVVCGYPVVAALTERARPPDVVPVGRLALVAVVFVGAVAGASAVRVTETRPAGGPEPLPEDPTAAYVVAVENTESTDHEIVHVRGDGARVGTTVDRTDRQFEQRVDFGGPGSTIYADAGVVYATRGGEPANLTWRTRPFGLAERTGGNWSALAYPGYWRVAGPTYDVDPGQFGLPEAGTGEWETVNDSGGTRTLALSDGDAVLAALFPTRPERVTYETADIRVRVDAERGVVTGGRARLNATMPDRNFSVEMRFEVRTDVDVETPQPPGPRTPHEWVWKLFAY